MVSQTQQNNLINMAIKLQHLPNSTQRHFTFILLRNKILSMGYNNGWKTNPTAAKYSYRFNAIHSEMAAIKNFRYDESILTECKMVNVRLKRSGGLGIAKPCERCLKFLEQYNLKEIWYTNTTRTLQATLTRLDRGSTLKVYPFVRL